MIILTLNAAKWFQTTLSVWQINCTKLYFLKGCEFVQTRDTPYGFFSVTTITNNYLLLMAGTDMITKHVTFW